MFGQHFYNSHTRKLISVFGTIFNEIYVRRLDSVGRVLEQNKVPLAYGPKKKFLARIQEEDDLTDTKVAIKLPRMSFEITSITYDSNSKLNKQNVRSIGSVSDPDSRDSKNTFAPYTIAIDLNVMVKNQDDGLQIVEQILPYFQPEYTVTIIEDPDLNIRNDVPIVLTGINLAEEYEGDFMTRNSIVYTLSFETKVRFYGPKNNKKIIRTVKTNVNDISTLDTIETQTVTTDPSDAGADEEYTILETYELGDE